ncbi:MAG: alkene reductase, partial [Chthoniobacterales bacterium]
LFEITDAVLSVWGASRVGVHLSPRGDTHDMGDSDPAALFNYMARGLGERKIAFICAREHQGDDALGVELKKSFGGVYIANEGFTFASANQVIADGVADAVAFGQLFIANPDLPKRFRLGAELNAPNPATFYGSTAEGYTDYPAL